MPKRATALDKSEIRLDQSAAEPLYRQLYERLRAEILTGQLDGGARLPSTRVLAGQLGVSRNTTALAYELLALEGYIESRVGGGTWVARVQPEQPARPGRGGLGRQAGASKGSEVALARRGRMLSDTPYPGDAYAGRGEAQTSLFRVGRPDVEHFPYDTWARLVARHARRSMRSAALYQNTQGYYALREAIAAHIGISRGVHCSPEQIIVTAGSQGALDLVSRVLLDPGDPAWIEDPGYLGARGALLAAGARLVPVPVDREGIDVAAGRQLEPAARLAAVTPSHQFPSAVTMSLGRRLALLEWAAAAQAWIVEDDYDSEYRYSGRPLEALQGLDGAGRVIYAGTFSKVLFPALRLGYLVAPVALLAGLRAARRFIDVHPPLLEQMALADFIAEGHFGRHLRRMRLLYLERRNTLVAALRQELGDLLDIAVAEAGLHLVAWMPAGVSAVAVAGLAASRGLNILPVSHFSLRPLERDGLLLGFAGGSSAELQAGVRTLALALGDCLT